MLVLGVETSCDETAVSIVDARNRRILSNVVYSQLEHLEYGGVVPEIAARAHVERLPTLVQQALDEASLKMEDVEGFAATAGPGLLGGLLVGTSYTKSLAMVMEKPFFATNHLEGHALTAQLTDGVEFPFLLLLVSGGHCQFIDVKGLGDYRVLGGTLDDAVGECFDKTAKILGLPYPGGPEIEKCAKNGAAGSVKLPLPMDDGSMDFSFSGLKTAVRTYVQKQEEINAQQRADICASFQDVVARIICKKVQKALDVTTSKKLVVAGGVAANLLLREKLENLCSENSVSFFRPPVHLCTDNAAMIAYAGGMHLMAGENSGLGASTQPRWPLASGDVL